MDLSTNGYQQQTSPGVPVCVQQQQTPVKNSPPTGMMTQRPNLRVVIPSLRGDVPVSQDQVSVLTPSTHKINYV